MLPYSPYRDRRCDVLPPRPDPDWKPHVSYHASGQYHVKGDGHPYHVSHWQKPDTSFLGTHNLSTMGIASNEPRITNAPCRSEDYAEVFEISVNDLRPDMYRTMLSVDLMEPSGQPIMTPGAKILRAGYLSGFYSLDHGDIV